MLMKKLETLARELGYSLERKNREVKWTRNDDKTCGVSIGIAEAYLDIILDYQQRLTSRKI